MRHSFLTICIAVYINLMGQAYDLPKAFDVGTVEFFRKGHRLSFPIVDLVEEDKLELRFDIFGSTKELLSYQIQLCDVDWSPVDLDPFEYLEGFEENQFRAYSSSMNTLIDYVHYRLDIPNEEVRILLPGNYKLIVFRNEDLEDEVFVKKFVVVEEQVRIDLWMDKFQSAIYENRQEIKARIVPGDIPFEELPGNIKLVVLQNNNWNTRKVTEKYTTDGKGNIDFNSTGLLTFPGVNEFRFFDMKSLKFISERVDFIEFRAPNYHVYLKTDNYRGEKQYFTNEDLNGLFFIGNQESHDPDTLDAEYAYVHFLLEAGIPLPADVYIEGAITNWQMKDNFMEFNPETGRYEKVLLLKQGLYNYRYVTKEYNSGYVSWDITEGSFFQTKNNYLGLLYYRPIGEIYFQPIGVGVHTTD